MCSLNLNPFSVKHFSLFFLSQMIKFSYNFLTQVEITGVFWVYFALTIVVWFAVWTIEQTLECRVLCLFKYTCVCPLQNDGNAGDVDELPPEVDSEEYSGLRAQDLQEAKDQLLVETADMLSIPLFTAEALLRNHGKWCTISRPPRLFASGS